jgi:hypothetical protein
MNSTFRARLAATLGAVALVAGGAVIAAPAAHAGGSDCASYLAKAPNQRSTTDVHLGCAVGALNLPVSPALCRGLLENASQVSGAVSDNACRYAKS